METLEHGLQCFARVVRCLLGPDSIAAKTLESGPSLCILGIDVVLSAAGIVMRPARDKAEKWMRMIRGALDAGMLRTGEASKLAGKVGWATTHMFRRIGRAMLRAVHDQKTRWDGKVEEQLARALKR